MKSRNSSLAKPVPLSETTMSGNPWVAKTCRSFSIVAVPLVLVVGYTSIHLLYSSITIRNNCPINGPALSICMSWDRGFSGHSQGCRCAAAGAALCNWHTLHDLTLSSMQCLYPALATIGSSEPDFSFWPFLGGWCAGPLKAVSDPELVSPHGSPTRYNHCVCLIRLSSRRKAPCFCQGIYHPSSAELFWEPAVALASK